MQITFMNSSPGASPSLHVFKQIEEKEGLSFRHKVDFVISPSDVGKVTGAKIMIQGSKDNSGVASGLTPPKDADGAIISPRLAVGTTATRIAHGLFYYLINGVNANIAENTSGVPFSAAHQVAPNKFGAINIYIDAAGDISTKINSISQTDILSYDTAFDALLNAFDIDMIHPADTISIGTVLIENSNVLWVANTDDMIDGSDVITATFYDKTSSFTKIHEHELTDGEIINQKGTFYLDPAFQDSWVRIFLSEMEGSGTFNIINTLIPNKRTYLQDGIS